MQEVDDLSAFSWTFMQEVYCYAREGEKKRAGRMPGLKARTRSGTLLKSQLSYGDTT